MVIASALLGDSELCYVSKAWKSGKEVWCDERERETKWNPRIHESMNSGIHESVNINPCLSHTVSDLIGTDDSQKKLELFATQLYMFRMYPTFWKAREEISWDQQEVQTQLLPLTTKVSHWIPETWWGNSNAWHSPLAS